MLNDEICKLRNRLNKSIENGEDYEIVYKLSVELDELIAKYYRIEGK
ncbi:MAG: aspartyl-phosphate phosphatase Spo0E family protein [Clostridia bacterium]|nr:aspartyl-phosphate phosphatase Spo0E family protein [Clostridia bacterium]